MSEQTHYWHKLWFGMGTEFARTQDILVAEIDRLRKKAGEHDGTPYLDSQFQRAFRENWVEPKQHPANAKLNDPEGIRIDVPPRKPAELLEEAERAALTGDDADVH